MYKCKTFNPALYNKCIILFFSPGLFAYVGWKNESLRPIDLNFFFDAERTFSSVTVFAHLPSSAYGLDLGFPAEIGLQCSSSGDDKILFTVDRNSAARKIQLMLKRDSCLGDRIRLSFRHSGKWMAISEVKFDSGKQQNTLFYRSLSLNA